MSFELSRVFLVGEHWVGILRWYSLIIDFHCYGCWSLILLELIEGRKLMLLCSLVDLLDVGVVDGEEGVHTLVDCSLQ